MQKTESHNGLGKVQFEQLFKEYFISLCNFGKTYVNDIEVSKEIVQDVFVNLWNKRETIDPSKQVKSYLFTSVKNRCFNYIRDNKKFQSHILDVEISGFELPFERDDIGFSELQDKIDETINALPEKIRNVFILSRFEGMKYREIAEKSGVSQKTVEAHISKALKILRVELQDYLIVFLLILVWLLSN